MYTLVPAFFLIASALASPKPVALPQEDALPQGDPPATNTPATRCKVNMEYVDDWWELGCPGSRWRYKVTWSDNSTVLSEHPIGDVLLAMQTPGCCALTDNPAAWQEGTDSIILDFGEVVSPVGLEKAKCQNTNIQIELAKTWDCDIGTGEGYNVRCA